MEKEQKIQKEVENIVEKLPDLEKNKLVEGLFTKETRYVGENFKQIYDRFHRGDVFKEFRGSKEGKKLKELFKEWAKDKVEYCKKCSFEMNKSGPYLHVKEEGQPVYEGPSKAYYFCMNEKCEDFEKNKEIEE